MLELLVEGDEYFDEDKQEFVYPEAFVLNLEHSLVSLSKWESFYEKPFLVPDKSNDEIMKYIYFMILDSSVKEDVLAKLSQKNLNEINSYIEAKYTGTTFRDTPNNTRGKEIITSELIYYWMVAYTIPWEAQHWHLNRLFSLLRVCDIKNNNKKPAAMSRNEMIAERQRINAERRAQASSAG